MKEKNNTIVSKTQKTEEGFLPLFSDYFLACIEHFIKSEVLIATIIITCFIVIQSIKNNILLNLYTILVWAGYVMLLRFSIKVLPKLKKIGYTFYDHYIESNFLGKKVYQYSEIVDALSDKKVQITHKNVVVFIRNRKLRFPYEIDNASQQPQIANVYRVLCRKVQGLPEFKFTKMDKFDKAFVYRRSFLRCTCLLVIFDCMLWYLTDNTIFQNYFILGIFLAFFQLYVMVRLIKCTNFGSKNYLELVKEYRELEHVELKIKYHRVWESIIITLIIITVQISIFMLRW